MNPSSQPTWNAPPNWPSPPDGWSPPPGWQPDPAWGPAPEGWEFTAAEEPVEQDSSPPPPVIKLLPLKRAWKILALLDRHLADGESVRGLFLATSFRPTLDFAAVTTSRVVAGSSLQPKDDLPISVDGAEITSVEATSGRMGSSKIRIDRRAGSAIEAFRLSTADVETFSRMVDQLTGAMGASGHSTGAPAVPGPSQPFGDTPEKAKHIADDLAHLLGYAAEACTRGDVVAEERHLHSAVGLASRVPMLSRRETRRWIESRIAAEARSGRVRKSTRLLGVVDAQGLGADDLRLYDDRIVCGKEAHALDARVSAAVELDGQVVVSHRPTMTRMAVGSILPGSALIPGMALQKKQSTDTRVARFMVVHPEWTLSVRIPPGNVSAVRPLALQVNRIADELRTAVTPPSPAPAAPPGDDVISKLERVGKLLEQGVITTEQATQLRDDVLRGT